MDGMRKSPEQTGGTAMLNDPAHVDRLAALIRPVPVLDFIGAVCRWLQDAHEAAAELQPWRKNNHRGNWNNNTSFGTDRYQYLLGTASSLAVDLPELDVDPAFQSVLVKLKRVGIYQFQVPSGPYGSLGDSSDLRRELLAPNDDSALLSRRDSWLTGRELLLLTWSGTEELGLTDAWAGQGTLRDNRMAWDWLVRLQDIVDGVRGPVVPVLPLDPAAFDRPQPPLPLRPRSEQPSGSPPRLSGI
jgi:hypothetical protein